MDRGPNEIGLRAELEVARACMRAEMGVFVPLFDAHGRVDLVVETQGRLLRVQCKSARLLGDHVVFFRTCSNTGNSPRAYVDEVDAFGVYAHSLDRVYLVPIEGLGVRGCHLRLGPTRNGQQKGIRFAVDYEVRPLVSRPGDGPIPGQ
jgi:hypothetical protein